MGAGAAAVILADPVAREELTMLELPGSPSSGDAGSVAAGVGSALTAGLALALFMGTEQATLALGTVLPTLVGLALARVTYDVLPTVCPRWDGSACMGVACAALLGVLGAAACALALGGPLSYGAGGTAFIGASAVLATSGLVCGAEVRGRKDRRRVFLLSTDAQRLDLAMDFSVRPDLQLVGWANVDPHENAELDISRISDEIAATGPTTLVLSDEAIRDERLVNVAAALNLRGVRVRELSGFYEQEFAKVAVSELSPSWFLFDIAEIHRSGIYGFAKRTIELVISGAVLLLTSPLFALIPLVIRLSSPGPVYFRQERVGKGGHRFVLTKFRTMHAGGELEHGSWAGESEGRLFPVGRWLRAFRLDELPQLLHVLRGQLSLVGPRPEQPAIVERLQESMEFYAARHSVRPGVTGWAQVNYGYGGSVEGATHKLQYDLFYIKRQSLKLDLRIIAATARAILQGRG